MNNKKTIGTTATRFGILCIITLFGLSSAALAQQSRYDACMKLIQEQPLSAYEEALAWQAEAGGSPARHCIASALLAMGELQRGAERLESLGYASDLGNDNLRVQIFLQAGEAFLQLADARALNSFDAGLALQPNNNELRLGRARALQAQEKPEQALDELNALLGVNPNHLLGLMLRASTLIQLERLEPAGLDVKKAMQLAPTNLDVLLLRGEWREAKRLAAQP